MKNYDLKDQDLLELIIRRITETRIDITRDYNDWVKEGMVIANYFGEAGRQKFHDISCLNERYDSNDADNKYSNLLGESRGEVSLGTFIEIANRYGVNTKRSVGRPRKNTDTDGNKEKQNKMESAIMVLQTAEKGFRYNEWTERVEKLTDEGWKAVNDRDISTYLTNLQLQGVNLNKQLLQALLKSEQFAKSVHPVKEYFSSLPQWTPDMPDFIQDYIDHFVFDDPENQPFYNKYLRKWLVYLVAVLIDKAEENPFAPSLRGTEYTGKNYMLAHLLPPELRDYMVVLPTGFNAKDKDDKLMLNERILIILDEFIIDKSTASVLKSIITITQTYVRRSYDTYSETRKRKASFAMTGNPLEYISDDEGERRYISGKVLETKNLNEYPINYEGLYGQLLYLVEKGDDIKPLSRNEINEIKEHNRRFHIMDPCQAAILKHYHVPAENEIGEFYTTGDVMTQISYICRNASPRDITKAMRMIRATSIEGHARMKKFYLKKNDDAELDMQRKKEGKEYFDELHKKPDIPEPEQQEFPF